MKRTKIQLITLVLLFIFNLLSAPCCYINSPFPPKARRAYIARSLLPVSASVNKTVELVIPVKQTPVETVSMTKARYARDDRNNARILKAQMAYQQALNDYNRRIQSGGASAMSQEDIQHALIAVNNSKAALDKAIQKYRRTLQADQRQL